MVLDILGTGREEGRQYQDVEVNSHELHRGDLRNFYDVRRYQEYKSTGVNRNSTITCNTADHTGMTGK